MDSIKRVNIPSYVVSRIGAIQQELEQLIKVINSQEGATKQKIRLKDLWKDVEVEEEDIQEAKQSLFRYEKLEETEYYPSQPIKRNAKDAME